MGRVLMVGVPGGTATAFARTATRALAAICGLVLLSGCGALCTGFDRRAADHMTPGVTTLAQATEHMGEEPASVYRRLDGSLTARWARSVSLVTDAVYCHRELWLAFGPDGTFQRVVKGPDAPPRAQDDATASGA